MGVYTQLDLNEINEILQHYQLGKATEFYSTKSGISNSNYRVVIEGDLEILLKVSNDKTWEQLNNEQQILKYLTDKKYPYVLGSYETKQKQNVYKHERFHGVIFPYIQGRPPSIVNSEQLKQIAKALAKLHILEKADAAQIRDYTDVGHNTVKIEEKVKSGKLPDDFVLAWRQIFPKGINHIPMSEFPTGIIHGDLYLDNTLFIQDSLIKLIDFEQAGVGSLLLDLGIAISGCCLINQEIDLNFVRIFIEEYEKTRTLSPLEKEYLAKAIIVGLFSISLWRIERFYWGDLDPTRKFHYRELIGMAKRFQEKINHLDHDRAFYQL